MRYFVELPLVGSLKFYDIEAASKEEAIKKAQEKLYRLRVVDFDNGEELTYIELGDEFETPEDAVQGNISHLPLTHAVVELEDEEDEGEED